MDLSLDHLDLLLVRRLVVDFIPVGVRKRVIIVLRHLLNLVVDFLGRVLFLSQLIIRLLEFQLFVDLFNCFFLLELLHGLHHQPDDILRGEVRVRRRTSDRSRNPHQGLSRQVMRRGVMLVCRSDSEIRLGYAVRGEVHFIVFQIIETDAAVIPAVARARSWIDGRLFDFVVFVSLCLGGAAFRRGARSIVCELLVFLGVHDLAPSLNIVKSHIFFLRIVYLAGLCRIRFYLPLCGQNPI